MKYSYNWLQRHIQEPLPQAKDLIETIIFHAFEVEDIETVGNDTVMEIKVLPDRAADCLSHAGMAREIAGLLNLTFVPAPTDIELPTNPLDISLNIENDLCDRYCAIRIDGVKIGPSPDWLKNSLEAVGQKSINNVVDVTNLVLLDSGQPTHAFDAEKINGGITIREARPQESIVTLSDETKELKESDLVIADDSGLLAIAGVKGGKKAEVSDSTTLIILEIAHFDAVSVRKTARRLSLLTDAAKRFENNISAETVGPVAKQLAGLILKVAGGEVKGVSDHYPHPLPERKIVFSTKDISRLLGNAITSDVITKVLNSYHYIYSVNGDGYELTVPYWRPDLTEACNIAEEIGRAYGYEHIESKSLPFAPSIEINETDLAIQKIKLYLLSQGYSEVMNYTFRKKGDIYVAYGAKDKSALRTNLADGLKESYEMNRLNAPLLGVSEVKIFEVGTIFTNEKEEIHVAVADKKGVEEYSLQEFLSKSASGFAEPVFSTPKEPVTSFKSWSIYPFITRDIAVWVPDPSTSSGQAKKLQDIVETFAAEHCARPAALFDTFTKDGKTSMGYRFVFQSFEKTLTDEDVEIPFKKLVDEINSHGLEIR
ncbi:MAG TPA: phenylalanine--tRNA ligase subunit beta [Candidatus Paceibacterota bacterium]|jgi:phenylalanyl-tRNA synthetase beta chain|nr:phenylalanine--tRNA ligase subunit beta [Candidatus Paceibacterota bacterium]